MIELINLIFIKKLNLNLICLIKEQNAKDLK